MKGPREPAEISAAFLYACNAELDALKPGNVHRYSAGHGMEVLHFEQAASAAVGPIADPALSVGKRILRATEAQRRSHRPQYQSRYRPALCAACQAAGETTFDVGLRRRLGIILSALDEQDAVDAFEAIRIASPAGLGNVENGDVHSTPEHLTLIAAMHLAAERDRIANAYVTVYADVFDFALPVLQEARTTSPAGSTLPITTLHMALLAEFPDTHIGRKYGPETAEAIQHEARALRPQWFPTATAKSLPELQNFDAN